jgi:YggT family protein
MNRSMACLLLIIVHSGVIPAAHRFLSLEDMVSLYLSRKKDTSMYALAIPLLSATQILDVLLLIYTCIIIAVAIFSWVNPDPLNPLVRILRNITEPVMEKLRPYVPLIGGLDLTPAILIVAIVFIRTGVLPIVSHFARGMIS